MHLSAHTALQGCDSSSQAFCTSSTLLVTLFAFPCVPSPCIGHYPDHLSTMDTPSPCASRRLGDPQVPLHPTSVLRFPVRPTCSHRVSLWRRSLVSLITALTNSTRRGLGFKQFSLNHIQRSCLASRPDFYRSCYCPLQVSHPGKTLL